MRGDDALAFIEQFVTAQRLEEFYSYTCKDLEHIDYMHHYEFEPRSQKNVTLPKRYGNRADAEIDSLILKITSVLRSCSSMDWGYCFICSYIYYRLNLAYYKEI